MALNLFEYLDDMPALVRLHQRELHAVSLQDAEAFRLQLLRKRFDFLKERVGALGKLAQLQGISCIDNLDDAVPVLFQHTVYKSYPPAFLEKGRFAALTQWLQQLTAHDLSRVDASKVQFVDDWFRLLEHETPVAPIHTTGTSGKLSIIPRTLADTALLQETSNAKWQGFGSEVDNVLDPRQLTAPIPIIHPGYRHGFYASLRMLDLNVKALSNEEMCESLYSDVMSADMLSLAGRVATAEAKGQLDRLEISPALLQRFRENRQRQHSKEADAAAFFERVIERFAGQRVLLGATSPLLYTWAKEGIKRGVRGLFAANSWISTGGGGKGMILPPDWKSQIEDVIGAKATMSYGMSELCSMAVRCEHGHYHLPPYLLPYLLDEQTGTPLPRKGVQTGRAAFVDLLVDSYWGGLITGDEITIHWDGACACGRQSAYVGPNIQRFTDKTGTDDKISCAGAPDAHDKAMDFLARLADENN